MKEKPMIWAWWGWEPLQFYRQAGPDTPGMHAVAPADLAAWYHWLHQESTVEAAAELGINCIVTHFMKGFGPQQEYAEMRQTAELTEKCHRHGIVVFGYLQYGSIFHETFFAERPEARDWIQISEDGQPQFWCNTPSRYLPCIHSEGFLDYLKSCLRNGLLETGLDGLHFDNFYLRPCYCPRCQKAFRNETGEELPTGKMLDETPEAPLVRRWTRFRCDLLTCRLKELRDYARSLRPDVLTIWNPSPIRGILNQRLLRGTDFYDLGRNAGMLWSESGNFPEIQQGNPIHQVNFFKTAEAVGYRTFSTVWRSSSAGGPGLPETSAEVALVTAEAAAFGGVPGSNWLMRPGYWKQFPQGTLIQEWKRLIDFIRDHAGLFCGSRGQGELALYFNREHAECDFAADYGQLLILEQLLLQKHFSFDLVFSGQEERLQNYPLVIGIGSGAAAGRRLMTFTAAELAGAVAGTGEARITLPEKANEIAGRIRTALMPRELEVELPGTLLLERRVAADGRELLHLVNYNNTQPVRRGRLRFRIPPIRLEWRSPDGHEMLAPSGDTVILPELSTWAVLVWHAEKKITAEEKPPGQVAAGIA